MQRLPAVPAHPPPAVAGGIEPPGVDVVAVHAALNQVHPGDSPERERRLAGDAGRLKHAGLDHRDRGRRFHRALGHLGSAGDGQLGKLNRGLLHLGIHRGHPARGDRGLHLDRPVAQPAEHQGLGPGGRPVDGVNPASIAHRLDRGTADGHDHPGQRLVVAGLGNGAPHRAGALLGRQRYRAGEQPEQEGESGTGAGEQRGRKTHWSSLGVGDGILVANEKLTGGTLAG